MPTPLSPEELDTLARRRANAKLGWYVHAVAFVLVNAVIFAMSRYAFGSRPWSVYPLLGWGLGLDVAQMRESDALAEARQALGPRALLGASCYDQLALAQRAYACVGQIKRIGLALIR